MSERRPKRREQIIVGTAPMCWSWDRCLVRRRVTCSLQQAVQIAPSVRKPIRLRRLTAIWRSRADAAREAASSAVKPHSHACHHPRPAECRPSDDRRCQRPSTMSTLRAVKQRLLRLSLSGATVRHGRLGGNGVRRLWCIRYDCHLPDQGQHLSATRERAVQDRAPAAA